jgi:hypothetical protein
MSAAASFAELFDAITDVVHAAGGPDKVAFIPIAAERVPELKASAIVDRITIHDRGTPGVYDLVAERGEHTYEPAPRP